MPRSFRVGCLSGVPIRISARLIECHCDIDGRSLFPYWLDGGSQPLLLVEPDATTVPAEYDDWLILRLDPNGQSPAMLPVGEVVDVTGVFDHPESRTCTMSPMPGDTYDLETPAPTDQCRYLFATTSLAIAERFPDPSPSLTESQSSEPSATPDSTLTPSLDPTPTPSPTATGPTPIPTPWPMAVMVGEGAAHNGLPFTFKVWVDHEGVAHGTFAGLVPGGTDFVAVDGPVVCASIEGNHGVFGWESAEHGIGFSAPVSDDPDGLILWMGSPDCVAPGAGDPASYPITEGFIEVIPEPTPDGS